MHGNADDQKKSRDSGAPVNGASAGADGFALGHRAALAATLSLLLLTLLAAGLLFFLFRPQAAVELPFEDNRAEETMSIPVTPFDPADFPLQLHAGIKLLPPFEAVSSTRLAGNGRPAIDLAYVEGLTRDAVCRVAQGRRLPCGLMGRAWLQNFLHGLEVYCEPRFIAGERPDYQCFAGGEDLARRQVRAGFARPSGYGFELYAAALQEAMTAEAGAWNGGWRVDP
ncbi:hypothetical protein CLD20_07850 [Afifella sp. IM 167]|nr:hypothetical protein [Afifella sp. IM 167]